MIRNSKIFLLMTLFFNLSARADSIRNEHSKRLLTKDYGILSDSDFKDAKISPAEWQCFSRKQVSVTFHRWIDTNPDTHRSVKMCDFEIWNKSTRPLQSYGLRRAKPDDYCVEFKQVWNKITKNAKYICIQGEPMAAATEMVDGKHLIVKGWIWNRIKSKNDCYDYFDGNCRK